MEESNPSNEVPATAANSPVFEPCIRYVRRKRTTKQPDEVIECLEKSSSHSFQPQPDKEIKCLEKLSSRSSQLQPDEEIVCLEISSSCPSQPISYHRKPRTRKGKAALGARLSTKDFDVHFQNLWKDLPEDKKMPFTFFDCLWFSAYMQSPEKESIQTWIKDKPVFSKKYVLIPIVYWGHWNLLIFCNFCESWESDRVPCMLLLDSLQLAGPERFEPAIRKFVSDILQFEGRPESKQSISQIPLLVPKVPQQTNDEDCGKFVLYFIDLFVRNAPREFIKEEYPYFMTEEWFNFKGFKDFCKKLKPLEQ